MVEFRNSLKLKNEKSYVTCNAYIVDVWTFTPHWHQGIASTMITIILEKLPGKHVCLFTRKVVGE
jgi:hypothetical protein